MTKMYVREYPDSGIFVQGQPIPAEPGVDQVVDYSGGAASSTAFKNNTKAVKVHVDSIASIAFGTAPTATTSNFRMAAGQTLDFIVPVGQAYKVSAITNT